MKSRLGSLRRLLPALLLATSAAAGGMLVVGPSGQAADAPGTPTPKAVCGPGSRPETGRQGRASLADAESGRSQEGYTCNSIRLSQYGTSGGYKVERYVDSSGNECAYYDTTLLFPLDVGRNGADLSGVFVLDMSDPANPVRTESLLTAGMQSPHETLTLHEGRGLLVAVTANPLFHAGVLDVYDVTADCRHPQLVSSTPVGYLGHESGFSPDGRTLYIASLYGQTLGAVDLTNPQLPTPIWLSTDFQPHGVSVSDDGTRLYVAERTTGLVILDVTEVHQRVTNPNVTVVSTLDWPLRSTPQMTIPITVEGRPYLIEMDEFANGPNVGAARIIDIADEKQPRVISDLRLEVHHPDVQEEQLADPGADFRLQGYAGHYCSVATRVDPEVVACTFIVSGMRLFDISDLESPREIAYYNQPGASKDPDSLPSAYAMSSLSLVPERHEVWYSDGNSGFHAVRITNGAWPGS